MDLDEDLLSVTTLTNGDAVVIASTDYFLLDRNYPPYYAIKLKGSSGISWQLDTSGNSEQAITIVGSWGYIDRTGVDARSVRYTALTEQGCIDAVLNAYKRLSGQNTTNTTIVTSQGILVMPEDVPMSLKNVIATLGKKY